VELVGVPPGIVTGKYGADVFENENAVLYFQVIRGKAFLKTRAV
jgi:hypothetical protein